MPRALLVVPRSIPTMYSGMGKTYSISSSAGAMIFESCLPKGGKIDGGCHPATVAQRSAWNLSACRHIADQLDTIRIRSFRRVYLLKSSFHAIHHRDQRDVAHQTSAAIGMQRSHGSADLIVRISIDVFHQEIDQTRIALQYLKDLQRSIRWLRQFNGRRRRHGLDVTERQCDSSGNTPEKRIEKKLRNADEIRDKNGLSNKDINRTTVLTLGRCTNLLDQNAIREYSKNKAVQICLKGELI